MVEPLLKIAEETNSKILHDLRLKNMSLRKDVAKLSQKATMQAKES